MVHYAPTKQNFILLFRGKIESLSSYRSKERYVKDVILSRDFDKDARPPGKNNVGESSRNLWWVKLFYSLLCYLLDDPTVISLSLYVMELGLCSKHQEVTLGGYFRY